MPAIVSPQRADLHVGALNCRIEFYRPVVNLSLTAGVSTRKLFWETYKDASCFSFLFPAAFFSLDTPYEAVELVEEFF